MSTLNGEITRLNTAKTDIKTEMNNILPSDHQIAENESISNYKNYFQYIQTGSSPIYINGDWFFYLGKRSNEIVNIFPDRIKGFTSMRHCFECDTNNSILYSAGSLDDIDTQYVADMRACFQKSNTSQNSVIDISKWNINYVNDVSYMFANGTNNYGNVLFPDYTTAGTTRPADCRYIFAGYSSPYCRLTSVEMGWIDTSYPDKAYYSNMFNDNSKITTITNFSLDYAFDDQNYQFPSGLTSLTWKPGNHAIARDYPGDFTLHLQNCTGLDAAPLLASIPAYTGSYNRTVRLKLAVYNNLTTEQINAFTAKGYSLTHTTS